jgi:hypothetical protein
MSNSHTRVGLSSGKDIEGGCPESVTISCPAGGLISADHDEAVRHSGVGEMDQIEDAAAKDRAGEAERNADRPDSRRPAVSRGPSRRKNRRRSRFRPPPRYRSRPKACHCRAPCDLHVVLSPPRAQRKDYNAGRSEVKTWFGPACSPQRSKAIRTRSDIALFSARLRCSAFMGLYLDDRWRNAV